MPVLYDGHGYFVTSSAHSTHQLRNYAHQSKLKSADFQTSFTPKLHHIFLSRSFAASRWDDSIIFSNKITLLWCLCCTYLFTLARTRTDWLKWWDEDAKPILLPLSLMPSHHIPYLLHSTKNISYNDCYHESWVTPKYSQ